MKRRFGLCHFFRVKDECGGAVWFVAASVEQGCQIYLDTMYQNGGKYTK
jgi:hypothetical protein